MDPTNFDPELDAAEVKKQRKAAKRAAAELAPPAVKDAGDDANVEAKKIRKAAKRASAAAAAAAAESLLEQAVDADVAAAEAKKKRKAARAAAREVAAAAEPDANLNTSGDLEAAEEKKARKLAKRVAAAAEDGDDEVDRQEPSMKKGKMEASDRETLKDSKPKVLSKGSKELEVVVLGLSPKIASADVRTHFAECGTIMDFRMPLNDEGGNKGIAFIVYKDAASCAEALKLYGTEYGGRFLVVRMALDESGKDGKGKGNRGSKEFEVFVGGLPWDAKEESVRKDFSECGEILALRMPLTKSGLKQGVAFIEYADKESTDKAMKFNATDYGGRWLDVRMTSNAPPSKDKGKGGKGCNELEVFVGGLPSTMTEGDLRQAFGKFGKIDTLQMPAPRESDTRRIAFIKFKEKDACGEALKLSETEMGGLKINVRMSGSSGSKGKTKGGKDGKGKSKGKGKGKKGNK